MAPSINSRVSTWVPMWRRVVQAPIFVDWRNIFREETTWRWASPGARFRSYAPLYFSSSCPKPALEYRWHLEYLGTYNCAYFWGRLPRGDYTSCVVAGGMQSANRFQVLCLFTGAMEVAIILAVQCWIVRMRRIVIVWTDIGEYLCRCVDMLARWT